MTVKVFGYLPKSEAAVYRCLQPFAEKYLFMSIFINKVAGLQLKNDSGRDVFHRVWLIFQNNFFCETRLGGDCCIPFSLSPRPHQQNVTLDLDYL